MFRLGEVRSQNTEIINVLSGDSSAADLRYASELVVLVVAEAGNRPLPWVTGTQSASYTVRRQRHCPGNLITIPLTPTTHYAVFVPPLSPLMLLLMVGNVWASG